MTHPCFACHEILTSNASGLCDNCEDRAMNDAEYEREAAADNARFEAEMVVREAAAREECKRRGLDPDANCADGGIDAWMIVDKELQQEKRKI